MGMRLCVFSLLQADVFSLVNRLARTLLMENTHTHTHTHGERGPENNNTDVVLTTWYVGTFLLR